MTEDVCSILDREWRNRMSMKHWFWMLAILVIGYYIGTKYPNLLASVGV